MLSQVSTTSCYFFGFISNNLKTNLLTPQEVGDWFGCEGKKGKFIVGVWFGCFCFLKRKKKRILF